MPKLSIEFCGTFFLTMHTTYVILLPGTNQLSFAVHKKGGFILWEDLDIYQSMPINGHKKFLTNLQKLKA